MIDVSTNDLFIMVSILVAVLASLLWTRMIVLPGLRARKAQKKSDEIMQRKALARMEEIRTAENDANDPWSKTCTRDTIVRELTKSQRLSLEKIGQNY